VHISSIRRKLGDDPKSPQFIQTIRGVGYMMRKP
jgi:DNA-binding response OmpR family regulator